MKEYLDNIIIWEYEITWILQIDTNLVIEHWSHLWYIFHSKVWGGNKFQLVKKLRKDSDIRDIKLTISEYQANILINKLKLNKYQEFFKNMWVYELKREY